MDRKIADIVYPSLYGEDSCDLCYRGSEARYTTLHGQVRVCGDCENSASNHGESLSGELMISSQVKGVLATRLQRLAELCQDTMTALAKAERELATKDELVYTLTAKNWALFHHNKENQAK